MCDGSMRSGTKLAREIQLTDWSIARNLSNRSSGVQIPRDICTRFGRYLYSTKCSWIIRQNINDPNSKYNFDCIHVQSSRLILNLGEIFMLHIMQQLKKLHLGEKHSVKFKCY